MSPRWIGTALACALLAGPAARGDMITYFTGNDAGAAAETGIPGSTAAAAAFAKAAGGAVESLQFPAATASPNLAGGMAPSTPIAGSASTAMTLTNADGVATLGLSPSNLDPNPPSGFYFGNTSSTDQVENNQWLGFNINSNGLHETGRYVVAPLLSASTATVTFTSSSGAAFDGFGFYLTGFGDVTKTTLTVAFTDASGTHSQQVYGSPTGGALYFGIMDAGADLTQFQLIINNNNSSADHPVTTATRDVFAINEIQLAVPSGRGSGPSAPEPASGVLLALGGLVVFARRRRRRRG